MFGQEQNFETKLSRSSGPVLSKTAIISEKQERKREISNESARGWSLWEANV